MIISLLVMIVNGVCDIGKLEGYLRERWDGVSYFQVDYYTIALE